MTNVKKFMVLILKNVEKIKIVILTHTGSLKRRTVFLKNGLIKICLNCPTLPNKQCFKKLNDTDLAFMQNEIS